MEVYTPRIIVSATEGGAALFPVAYFQREAFLAQSPQLYKEQLALAFEKVFEIADQLDDSELRCESLLQQAAVNMEIGRGDLVLELLERARVIADELDDPNRMMRVYGLKGHNHFKIASVEEASLYFQQALEIAQAFLDEVYPGIHILYLNVGLSCFST